MSQLNYYYKNKEGLFTEVIRILSQQYLSEIGDVFKQGKPGKDNLLALSGYFKGILNTKPELFTILFDFSNMALWSEPTKELLNSLFGDMSRLIETYILDGCDDMLQGQPSQAVARVLLGAILGTSIQVVLAQEREDLLDSLSVLKIIFE